ncbi:MAG: BatA domain-containing protein, partial [Thermoguttaceae bacterium]|nr:BatA domain-containing protein [Thermoguttaceae bacterium]
MLPFIFTRPAALWALALCALPALIYWFRRRQKSVVRWGAMRFLAAAQEKVQRKNRLIEFLILALQT